MEPLHERLEILRAKIIRRMESNNISLTNTYAMTANKDLRWVVDELTKVRDFSKEYRLPED